MGLEGKMTTAINGLSFLGKVRKNETESPINAYSIFHKNLTNKDN